ncbi:MAG: hypothetical protein QM808_16290 [Steroidobacteraceae bacterium]
MNNISMTLNTFKAVDDARDFTRRALSAADAAKLFDSGATVALDQVRSQLRGCLIQLQHLKDHARVMP